MSYDRIPVSTFLHNQDVPETINRARHYAGLEPVKRKQRKCMRCSRYFMSAHAGNRLCEDCRAYAAQASTGAFLEIPD